MSASFREPINMRLSRTPLGHQAELARVLSSIVSQNDPFDQRAPSMTVCRLVDGRFAILETTAAGSVVVGSPLSIQDAADLAMGVVNGDAVIASNAYTTHALATVLLGLLAGAALEVTDTQHTDEERVVVQFPSARGAG